MVLELLLELLMKMEWQELQKKNIILPKERLENTRKSKLPDYEVFFDPLALPISTGIEEDRLNAKETIKAISKNS